MSEPRELKKNVGQIDRAFRLILACTLVWLGIFVLGGLSGSVLGVLVAACALFPLYMVITRSCFVFRWFNIHSCSVKELERDAKAGSNLSTEVPETKMDQKH